jgi:hypothetical protein
MPEAAKSRPSAEASAETAPNKSWWKLVLTQRWLAALVIGSLIVHGMVFALVRKSAGRAAAQPEYTVGTFSFVAGEPSDSRTVAGKFDLHVRFLDELDAPARQRIASHQYRVRESIEGLLRDSQGLNLDEPALTRLKHEIQERIDGALDLRAVAEVIITDMSVPVPGAAPTAATPASSSGTPTAAASTGAVTAGRSASAGNAASAGRVSTDTIDN